MNMKKVDNTQILLFRQLRLARLSLSSSYEIMKLYGGFSDTALGTIKTIRDIVSSICDVLMDSFDVSDQDYKS